MFLSKKLIITIISLTGILFAILLIIQFVWIKRSVEVSRRTFENKMDIVRDGLHKSFENKNLDSAFESSVLPLDLFKWSNETKPFDLLIVKVLDSVFKSQGIYIPCKVAGRVGTKCYIHDFNSTATHNYDLDSASYKICLCTRSFAPYRLDIGFSFPGINKYLIKDNSWLIVPSFLLILLLIALFIFIIRIINKQKTLAELKNDFINNLTHEFNTPLFSIGLTSKMLLSAEEINSSSRLKKYIELINTEKNRLQVQVDKMLQLTAIESGSLLLEKSPVDINKVIEKNIAGFTGAIEEKDRPHQLLS